MADKFNIPKIKQNYQRLVAAKVNNTVARQAFRIARQIAPEVTQAVNQFFQSIVPLMGHEADLFSQVAIPGLTPWEPLSIEYAKRKAHARFFLYSNLSSSSPHRRLSTYDFLRGKTAPLIPTLEALPGSWAFGKTAIKVTDWRNTTVDENSFLPPPIEAAEVRFTLWIKPFGELHKSDLPLFERWLAEHGVIDNSILYKLTNPRGRQRPLLRPWLAHYADVILPSVIEDALTTRFHRIVKVRVVRPWDKGPF